MVVRSTISGKGCPLKKRRSDVALIYGGTHPQLRR